MTRPRSSRRASGGKCSAPPRPQKRSAEGVAQRAAGRANEGAGATAHDAAAGLAQRKSAVAENREVEIASGLAKAALTAFGRAFDTRARVRQTTSSRNPRKTIGRNIGEILGGDLQTRTGSHHRTRGPSDAVHGAMVAPRVNRGVSALETIYDGVREILS